MKWCRCPVAAVKTPTHPWSPNRLIAWPLSDGAQGWHRFWVFTLSTSRLFLWVLSYRTHFLSPVTMELIQVSVCLSDSNEMAASTRRWHYISISWLDTRFCSSDAKRGDIRCSNMIDFDLSKLLTADVFSFADSQNLAGGAAQDCAWRDDLTEADLPGSSLRCKCKRANPVPWAQILCPWQACCWFCRLIQRHSVQFGSGRI